MPSLLASELEAGWTGKFWTLHMLCLYVVSSREAVRQISLNNLASFPFHGSLYLWAVTILFVSYNERPNYGLA